MSDFLFRGTMADLDPKIHQLTEIEAERQYKKLILIPSESTSPEAVREALSSTFHNIYAEGYPEEASRWLTEDEILDYEERLPYYRRFSDPRYYKGVEYANIIEALARRRAAEAYAANGLGPDEIYVNVQALSGGPANNAVYHALVNPGDTVMGMNLLHGGHLSHGSPVNRSGKYYNIVHYTVHPETEKIDFDQIKRLALEHKPKMIIAGYSSYSWQVDWTKFREIADMVGAYLLADISHISGLVVGGEHPSPIGIADVVTTTTHKTLCGPRGALIMTTRPLLSRKIDRAVFPGEQGGPHVNVFAALAIALKLAKTEEFARLQKQIVKNSIALAAQLEKRGFRIPFGGTNTHIVNLDLKSVVSQEGVTLSGDQGARILDIAGIVVNRNTIPGDRSALNPSGLRLGTPWISQRGFDEAKTAQVADLIADLLLACKPYRQKSNRRLSQRAKVDYQTLEDVKIKVRQMATSAGIDYSPSETGYPHFYFRDDKPKSAKAYASFAVSGDKARAFLNFALSADLELLQQGKAAATKVYLDGKPVDGKLHKVADEEYILQFSKTDAIPAVTWLRALSDGFVDFDQDLRKKLPGPISVSEVEFDELTVEVADPLIVEKPFYIGMSQIGGKALPDFEWTAPADPPVQKTALNETHRQLGAKMIPFAGWDMPVWYTSVMDEHLAVRNAAGLFDVSHMGVYQAEGAEAALFLDTVCGNDIGSLEVGESLYTHFLLPDASVVDDLLVYRRGREKYLVVVNASNDDKDWAWLTAVKDGKVKIDQNHPAAKGFGRGVILRNLRDPKEGKDMRVDIALQGPKSRDILLALGCDQATQKRILKLTRTQLCEAVVGGIDLVVSRTGYTGENMCFELFVHPDQSVELWNKLMAAGEPFGMLPCGLGARDSLRTEAGLPLYGHEMGGENNLGVGDAGFCTYVKTYKPWFIGREAFLAQEDTRKSEVVRFRFNEKGVRMAHLGDPVIDKRGKTIGYVTSCAADKQGMLTGQAYIDLKYAEKDTPIFIFQSAPDKASKAPAELTIGDRTHLPNAALVISRFP
ncbi:MAG: glycine cleavage system aminomethyltransferase GcvT [Anaerolineales bacterium]|nr:glycine cleavage system aminomethyltransferase GcvT [Anaerolineales bacterium]